MKEGLNKKKPDFNRQDSNKYNFNSKWRKPRGLHSKMRLRKKGHGKVPGVGYGSPKLDDVVKRILVNNIKELEGIKKGVVTISSKVGLRNKITLLEECKKRKIKVGNVKDIDEFISKAMKSFEDKKKQKKKIVEKKKLEEKKKEVKGKKESQEEIKKDVLDSKVKEVPKAQKESTVKESKVDTVRQRVIPGGKK
tara:strand:+ start:950 stop:1531 length:582 start_codon:yes stop_codon:yes gene_type:complete